MNINEQNSFFTAEWVAAFLQQFIVPTLQLNGPNVSDIFSSEEIKFLHLSLFCHNLIISLKIGILLYDIVCRAKLFFKALKIDATACEAFVQIFSTCMVKLF